MTTSNELLARAIFFRNQTLATKDLDPIKHRPSGWKQERTAMARYAVQAVALRRLGR